MIKNTMKNLKNILWAVDIFGETHFQTQAARTLRALTNDTSASVEPVFVLTPERMHISKNRFSLLKEFYQSSAEQKLFEIEQNCMLCHPEEPTVLLESENSIKAAIHRLLEHAYSKDIDLIVVSTHAKKGLSRLLMGSFAETLLLQSKIPVLIINPSTLTKEKISHIFFPTNFGQVSRRGFESALDLAKKLGAKLTLYYNDLLSLPNLFPETPNLYLYNETEIKQQKKLAKAWLAWGRSRDVLVNMIFDERPGSLGNIALNYAKSIQADLIAMVTETGLGNDTCQIIRNAECPVWVQYNKAK